MGTPARRRHDETRAHWLNDETKRWGLVRCCGCGQSFYAFVDRLHTRMNCGAADGPGAEAENAAQNARHAPDNEKGRNL
jgi:hypothetical protein